MLVTNGWKPFNIVFYYVKPRPNDHNMPTQHIAMLLSATCCVHLATVLRHVATCWVLLAQIWKWSKLTQQHPTCRNTLQHSGQKHATCCTQRCDMLRWYVAIIWPGLKHQWNTRWTFACKLDILTLENNMLFHTWKLHYFQKWKDHHWYGYAIPQKELIRVPLWSKHHRFFL